MTCSSRFSAVSGEEWFLGELLQFPTPQQVQYVQKRERPYMVVRLIVTLRTDLAISDRKGDGKFPKRSGGCAGQINGRTSAAFGNGCA